MLRERFLAIELVNAAFFDSTPGTGPNDDRWIVRVAKDPGPIGGEDIMFTVTAICAK
jgi:hypothetical protein